MPRVSAMTYQQWAARHPQAAADLQQVINPAMAPAEGSEGKSESWAQQQARFKIAHAGAFSWRNNVFATPAKCPHCKTPQQPVRGGLANDSSKLNKKIKSSDLILAIPRLITQDMVGTTIAQFGSVEVKKPGWKFSGNEHEEAQLAWLALVAKVGGFAAFSTGDVQL